MKKTILAILVTLSILISAVIPVIGDCIKNENSEILGEFDCPIEFVKEIWDADSDTWVKEIEAEIDQVLRFKITVTYHDTDGPTDPDNEIGYGYAIRWINVNDTLPLNLEYAGNPSRPVTYISPDLKFINWNFTGPGSWLEDGEWADVQFDVVVRDYGMHINYADITAQEKCVSEWRYNESTATVFVQPPGPDYVEKDVDDDGLKEKAIDMNHDPLDGYEVFLDDNNGNSVSILSRDANGDLLVDHFIDINNTLLDWDSVPERYWDPVLDILDDVDIIDVDYDGTEEWVFDSNGDTNKDTYYDPDDDAFHPYVIYELNVIPNSLDGIGNGTIDIDPSGDASPYYLEDFVVTITAVPDESSKFVNWTGDINNDSISTFVIMNEAKSITANFKEDDTPPDTRDPTVTIIKPKDNKLYKDDEKIRDLILKTRVLGGITIQADAKDEGEHASGIDKVVFKVEGMDPVEDDQAPYKFKYDQQFILPHLVTVNVTAYDKAGNTASDEVTFWKMSSFNFFRNHSKLALLLLAGGAALMLLRGRGSDNETEPDDDDDDGADDGDSEKSPNADAGGDYYGAPGVKIEFDASRSSDPNGDNLEFHWDFGDGSSGSGEKVSHVYQKEGTYSVILTVTDGSGLSDKDTIKVTISSDYKEKEEDEGEIFWYIVTGLSILLLGALVALYLGRKLYV